MWLKSITFIKCYVFIITLLGLIINIHLFEFSFEPMHLEFYKKNLLALHNGLKSNTAIIFISGMYGNFLLPKYVSKLYEHFTSKNLFFIQPQLRSFPNFGLKSLNDDIQDIKDLIKFYNLKKIILIGHSTGCQDIMYILSKNVIFAILQGPVSDREILINNTFIFNENKGIINNIDQNNSDDKSCIDSMKLSALIEKIEESSLELFYFNKTPIRKCRFLSLYKKYGMDDIFSSDLEDRHFEKLNEFGIPLYFVLSKNDQYVFKSNKEKLKLIRNSKIIEIDGNHEIEGYENDFLTILDSIFMKYELY